MILMRILIYGAGVIGSLENYQTLISMICHAYCPGTSCMNHLLNRKRIKGKRVTRKILWTVTINGKTCRK